MAVPLMRELRTMRTTMIEQAEELEKVIPTLEAISEHAASINRSVARVHREHAQLLQTIISKTGREEIVEAGQVLDVDYDYHAIAIVQ